MQRWKSTRRGGRWPTLEERDTTRLGLVAITLLVVAVIAAVAINSLNFGDRQVRVDFIQAAQLGAGDQVTVAGVPVGHVSDVRLDADRVAVTMNINDTVHLGDDTRAAIKLTTLLGNRYVELVPAGPGSLSSSRIPVEHTTVPYDLQSALSDATTTFDQVDADKVAQALTDLSGQLGGLPQLMPPILQNIQTLSAVIAQRRGQLGTLLTSTSQLTEAVHSQQGNLGVLITQGGELLHVILTRKQAIEKMVSATTTLVQQLEPLMVDNRGEIESLLANLNDMTGMLSRHDDLLRNILEILPVPWRSWANLTGTAPELDATASSGAFIDSFMCALVGRAPQVQLPPYRQECQ